jgi:hypothetical protein
MTNFRRWQYQAECLNYKFTNTQNSIITNVINYKNTFVGRN